MPLIAASGYAAPETGAAFGRARELAERLGDRAQLIRALYGLWANRVLLAELRDAEALADLLLRHATEAGEQAVVLVARRALGMSRYLLGDQAGGRASIEAALEAYDPSVHRAARRKRFRGVVDLVAQKAYVYQPDGSGKFTESAIPADMSDAAAAAREALIEMVAEADESLMEKFFEAGTLTQDAAGGGLRAATASGEVFPLLCAASAASTSAVQPLLDAIVAYVPSPTARPVQARECQDRRGESKPAVSESGAAFAPSCGRPLPTRSPAASRCFASCRAW